MDKDKKITKYWIVENPLCEGNLAFSLMTTGVSECILLCILSHYKGNNFFDWSQINCPQFIGSIILSMILGSIASIIRSYFHIKRIDDNLIGKIYNLLPEIINAARNSQHNQHQGYSDIISKYNYYLTEMSRATNETLKFSPDSPAFEELFDMIGSISITEASPSEWLTPTYNFFLINHYSSMIKKRFNNGSLFKIAISNNRDCNNFVEYFNKGKNLIDNFSESKNFNDIQSILDDCDIRFYILKKSEIESHKGFIETLVAGHELFGIHLYIVSDEIYNIMQDGSELRKSMIDQFTNDNHHLDLMFKKVNDNIKYVVRRDDHLTSTIISEPLKKETLASFIINICKAIKANNTIIAYPNDNFSFNTDYYQSYIMNQKQCHLFFN